MGVHQSGTPSSPPVLRSDPGRLRVWAVRWQGSAVGRQGDALRCLQLCDDEKCFSPGIFRKPLDLSKQISFCNDRMYDYDSHHELHRVSKLLTILPLRLGGERLSKNRMTDGRGLALLDRIFSANAYGLEFL